MSEASVSSSYARTGALARFLKTSERFGGVANTAARGLQPSAATVASNVRSFSSGFSPFRSASQHSATGVLAALRRTGRDKSPTKSSSISEPQAPSPRLIGRHQMPGPAHAVEAALRVEDESKLNPYLAKYQTRSSAGVFPSRSRAEEFLSGSDESPCGSDAEAGSRAFQRRDTQEFREPASLHPPVAGSRCAQCECNREAMEFAWECFLKEQQGKLVAERCALEREEDGARKSLHVEAVFRARLLYAVFMEKLTRGTSDVAQDGRESAHRGIAEELDAWLTVVSARSPNKVRRAAAIPTAAPPAAARTQSKTTPGGPAAPHSSHRVKRHKVLGHRGSRGEENDVPVPLSPACSTVTADTFSGLTAVRPAEGLLNVDVTQQMAALRDENEELHRQQDLLQQQMVEEKAEWNELYKNMQDALQFLLKERRTSSSDGSTALTVHGEMSQYHEASAAPARLSGRRQIVGSGSAASLGASPSIGEGKGRRAGESGLSSHAAPPVTWSPVKDTDAIVSHPDEHLSPLHKQTPVQSFSALGVPDGVKQLFPPEHRDANLGIKTDLDWGHRHLLYRELDSLSQPPRVEEGSSSAKMFKSESNNAHEAMVRSPRGLHAHVAYRQRILPLSGVSTAHHYEVPMSS